MTSIETEKLFQQFAKIKVAVVGDVMLDTYWWGAAERISPEAPVPVVTLHTTEHRIGGAANVALNALALTPSVTLLSVIGRDEEGILLLDQLKKKGINTEGIISMPQRKTTSKTRVISRNQQMIRLDRETLADLSMEEETMFINSCISCLREFKPDVLIFEDYNKGVLTFNAIQVLISFCKENGIFTSVDPKLKNFFAYKGADLFKPNLKEIREGLRINHEDVNPEILTSMHEQLYLKLQHKMSLITLSEKGIFYQQQDGSSSLLPSFRRSIADVSGAGDTVIAVASIVFAATKDPALMATLANLAGGLVCEEVGTMPVNRDRLVQECIRLNIVSKA